MSLRDTILAANDTKVRSIHIGEWGDVFIRTWSGKERADFQSWFAKNREAPDINTRIALLSLSDEAGARLFNDSDLAALHAKSANALQTVMIAALEHNGISEHAVEDAKKNLRQNPSGDSISG